MKAIIKWIRNIILRIKYRKYRYYTASYTRPMDDKYEYALPSGLFEDGMDFVQKDFRHAGMVFYSEAKLDDSAEDPYKMSLPISYKCKRSIE